MTIITWKCVVSPISKTLLMVAGARRRLFPLLQARQGVAAGHVVGMSKLHVDDDTVFTNVTNIIMQSRKRLNPIIIQDSHRET